MANIKLSELSSVNQLDAQELNQVVGGSKWWGYSYYYAPKKVNVNAFSFNTQVNDFDATLVQIGNYKNNGNINQQGSNSISGSSKVYA